jgi:hypothetical protein
MEETTYIHKSWFDLNLNNIFTIYNSIIEKLNKIKIDYSPKEEKEILSFLNQDISNIKILFIRCNRIDDHFTYQEKDQISNYIKEKKIISISFNLSSINTKTSAKSENIWIPLLNEVLLILFSRLNIILFEKTRTLTKDVINNLIPNKNIMRYSGVIDENASLLFNAVIRTFELKEKYNI